MSFVARVFCLSLITLFFSTHTCFSQCSVNAGANVSVCAGTGVTLIAQVSGGTPANFVWNTIPPGPPLGNNDTLVLNNPASGQYTVLINGNGCNDIDTVQVTVNPLPNVPTFSFTGNNQCENLPVNFTITNPQPGVSYTWNFGDGGNATGQNVSHSYNTNPGTGTIAFNVSVTATITATGCTRPGNTQTVNVRQRPNALLTDPINNFRFCGIGSSAVLTIFDQSTPTTNSNYLINWGDGTPNYSSSTAPSGLQHTYLTGVYNITYTVTGTNGCTDTRTFPVYNISNPQIGAANPGNTQGCGPKTICFPINTFANNDSTTTYTVNFGDGSPTQVYSHPPPDTICHTYTLTSCGQPNNAYTFQIVAGNGCDTSIATIYPVRVYIGPTAQFTASPNPACINTSVTFTNNSLVGSNSQCDTTTLYTWNFGDGTPNVVTTSKASQLHSYTASGNYTVTLSAQNSCGTSPASQVVCIQSPPTPAFSANPLTGCAPLVVNVTDASSNLPVCGPLTRLYTVTKTGSTCPPDSAQDFAFISNTTSASPSPVIRFNNQGTYTITLALTNACGTFTTQPQTITVNRRPIVSASATTPVCLGTPVQATGNVTTCGSPVTSYAWSFPGGTPASSNLQNPPAVTYSTAGLKNITLTATNACGAQTAATSADILITPIANAGPDQQACSGNTVNIGSANVAGVTYAWTPATGLNSTTVSNPVVTLTNTGSTVLTQSYIVTATNAAGCFSRDTVVVSIYPPAIVDAGPSVTICASLATTLAGSRSGAATSSQWTSSAGGTFSAASSLTSTYTPAIGNGTVILTLTSNDPVGPCPAAADSMVITVLPPPTANAGNDIPICGGSTAQLGISNQPGYTYVWSPPTGLNSTNISNPTATLNNNGSTIINQTYTVIASALGCSDTDQVVVSVYPPAVVSAGPDVAVCANASINLTGSFSGGASSITWSSASGSFNPANNVNTSFTPNISSGIAQVTITTNDPTGPCNAVTATADITVNPIPAMSGLSPVTVCEGTATSAVTLSSTVAGATFAWSGTSSNGITGFPASGTSSSIPSFTPVNPNNTAGTIAYSITPTANGCAGIPSNLVYNVNPLPSVNAISPQTICSNQSTVQVTPVSPVAGTTFTWTANASSGNITGFSIGNSGNIPAQTIINNGSIPGTVTYTITPSANGCPGPGTNFVVTINPRPVINTIPNQDICSGQSSTAVTPTANVSGTTFTWTASGAGVTGFTASGTGSIPAQVLTNITTAPALLTYTITPTANNCVGNPLPYTITVSPRPVAIANPVNDTICSGTNTSIGLSSNVANTTFNWTVNAPPTISGASNGSGNVISQNLVSTSATIQAVVYTITPTANNCAGNPITVTVYVNPGVTINFSPANQAICSGQTSALVTLSSPTSGSSLSWTSQANGATGVIASGTNTIPAQTLGNTTNAPIIVTYTAIASFAGCASQTATYTITVNPIPTVNNLAPISVCENSATSAVSLSSNVSGTTFSWSGASANGITNFPLNGNTANIPAFTPSNPNSTAGTINYSITPSANNCPGPVYNLVYTVNPLPSVNPITPQAICSGASTSIVIPASPVANTTFAWVATTSSGNLTGFTPSGAGSIPAQAITNTGNTTETVTYNITPTANNCPGSPGNFIVTLNPTPNVNAISNQSICSGQSTTVVNPSSNVSGTTFSWTATGPGVTGFTPTGNGNIPVQTLTNNGNTPAIVTYAITPTANNCVGTIVTYTVTVNPRPTASAAPNTDTICSGSTTLINLTSNVANTTFSWTVNAPASISGASNGNGNTIQQNLVSTSSTIQAVVYTITPTANNCPGTPIVVTVYVNPGIIVNFLPGNQSICSGQTSALVTLSSPTNGVSFNWTSQANGVTGVAASGNNTIPTQTLGNSTNAPLQVNYNATGTFNGCTSQAFTYTITVNPIPTVTTSPLLQTVCEGQATQAIALTSAVVGATFTWTGNSASGISGFATSGNTSTIGPFTLSNPNVTTGSVIYNITPSANSCPGPIAVYTINVNPLPNLTVPAPQTICSGDTTQSVVLNAVVSGTTFSWSSTATVGITGNIQNGTGNIPSQTLFNSTPNAGTATYTVTPSANNCNGSTGNLVITVNPSPAVAFSQPSQTICSGQTTLVNNLTSTTPNVSITWTAVVPAGITGADTTGTNIIQAQTLTNSTSAPLTITYTALAVTNGLACPGTPASASVIVNPTPDVIPSISSDTICSNTRINIGLTSNIAGTGFSWTVNAPPSITGSSNSSGTTINDSLINTSPVSVLVSYNIQSTASGCPGQSTVVTILVYPTPQVIFTPSAGQQICDSASTVAVAITSLTPNTVVNWTASYPSSITGVANSGTDSIPTQTLYNSSNQVQQVTYAVNSTFMGCPGLNSSYTISVNPTSHILNTDTIQTVCSGDSTLQIVPVSDVVGATFNWSTVGNPLLSGYILNGNGNLPSQNIINNTTQDQLLTYTIMPSFLGCPGIPQEFTFTIRPRPSLTLLPDTQSICSNNISAAIACLSNIPGTTFNWTSTSFQVSGAPPSGSGDTIPAMGLINTSVNADTGYVTFLVSPVNNGCPGTDKTAYVQVNPTPVVNFSMSQNFGCSPVHVNFTTNPFVFGNPDSLVFNWGDGTAATTLFKNPIQPFWSTIQHSFSNTGFTTLTYVVSLTAANQCGDTTVYDTVTVLPNTIDAAFTPSTNTGCEPLTVSFTNNSTGGLFASWCFDYDILTNTCLSTPVIDTANIVSHTFMAGTYLVALYINDGCSQDTAFTTIQVNPSPVSNFTFQDNVCAGTTVNFTDQSTFPAGQFLTAYSWNFGDSTTALSQNASKLYDTAGVYNVCHTVTSSNGCSNTLCLPLNIISTPEVNFSAFDTCVNSQPIFFINQTTGANFYQWYFGDANTSVLPNPAHNYLLAGSYNVKLVASTLSCVDSATRTVTIYPKPTSGFTLPTTYGCGEPSSIQIQNNSIGALGYLWDFGNTTTSTLVNPTVTYLSAGVYNISLISSNQFNCYDTAIKPITIYPLPIVSNINVNPISGCQPLTVAVDATVANGNQFIWDFGDGTSPVSTTLPTVIHTYYDTGVYTITLQVYSFMDCGDTIQVNDQITAYVTPFANFSHFQNVTVEPIDGTIEFTNLSENATQYSWDFGDGQSSSEINPIYQFPRVDSFMVTLTASTDNGCSDDTTLKIFVFKRSLWVPNAFAPDYSGPSDLVKIWQPIGTGLKTYKAQVFNTWGELLWESDKIKDYMPEEFWDGTYQGKPCQQDAYVWKVEATFLDGYRWPGMTYEQGGTKKTIGSITLVR